MLRRLGLPLMLLALAGCAATAGRGLWAGQAVRLEEESYRLSDQQRAEAAWQSELRLVNGWLGDQAGRLRAGLVVCPGESPSPSSDAVDRAVDRAVVRDGVRARVAADAANAAGPAHGPAGQSLLEAVRQSALADWHLRRAAATGDVRHCQSARTAVESLDRALAAAQQEGASRAPETPPSSPDAPRVAVRVDSIEALPLLLARRTGAANVALIDAGAANPVDAVGRGSDAAVGTTVDLLLSGRSDLVDAYSFFDRAPVAVAAPDGALASLVLADAAHRPLEVGVARWLQTSASLPRGVTGGDWVSLLAWYKAGAVDAVLAPAPLPQYLTDHYGGAIVWDATDETTAPRVGAGSLFVPESAEADRLTALVAATRRGAEALSVMPPEDVVDLVAADFPDWEPDAVLDLVRVAKRCLNVSGRLDQAAADRAAELAAFAGRGQP